MIQYVIAQGLSDLLQYGKLDYIEDAEMSEDEQGYSGAKLMRKRLVFENGTSRTIIFKLADLKERCAMIRLTGQNQCSPVSFAEDTVSDVPKWLAMEDLGSQRFPDANDEAWLSKVARNLAKIHVDNMNKGHEMSWLPIADRDYWEAVVSTLSLTHVEKEIEENPTFAEQFGKYLPELQENARKFVEDMMALCREPNCMTLTHGDLQTPSGSHIYCCNGEPRIIDFGFCRYAPFYIDLAGWFCSRNNRLYYNELQKQGMELSYADFEERANSSARYNGFIYLYPSLMAYKRGNMAEFLQSLSKILGKDML